ncbi:MAG TPA: Crp/Fnr family transcriptional regulator [Oligoflexia bacterium]|mgnify:CR=1 FL=1|nr:Crp/Fnr family transcriptional regulator [Oligoflexia bacterium]
MSKKAAFDFIKEIPTFSQLPGDALSSLAEQSRFASIRSGDYIAFEGSQDEASFIVVSGRLAMTKSSMSGKDLVVQLLGPGDFFGMVLAIEKLPSQLSARAQTDAEVLWIPTEALLGVLSGHPVLYKGFVAQLSDWLHTAHKLSRGLAHDSVEVRIAALLVLLAAKFARTRDENNDPIVVDITRQHIADLTGTTPETATRVTRSMHRTGLIEVNKPGVIIVKNLQALKKLAES